MNVQLFDRIDDVPRQPWDRLLEGRSVTFAREFWQVIEGSGLNDLRIRHALFFDDDGSPCGLANLYSITTDIAIFAPTWLRRPLAAMRRVFPRFLTLPMLECGTPVTLNSPPFVLLAAADTAFVQALDALLRREARKDGCWVIVVRDFEPGTESLLRLFKRHRYRRVDGLPNTYLDIAWSSPDEYLASMRSYYRSKLLKHLRRCREAGIRHENTGDFGSLAPELCRQWRVVHEAADEFQREVLTERFYREFGSALPCRAMALLLYRGEQIVGHALLLLDGDLLRWLYFGRSEARNDSLYIYVAYQVVETAIRLGVRRVEMGLTTYPVKQDLGARAVPIRFALRGLSWWIDIFIVPVYSLLNRTRVPRQRMVFKDSPRGPGKP